MTKRLVAEKTDEWEVHLSLDLVRIARTPVQGPARKANERT